METVKLPKPQERRFLPNEFKVTVWSKLKPYYNELLRREINSVEELGKWISDFSELDALVSEDFAWRYVKITVDSTDEKALELYNYALQELSPHISKLENQLNNKLVASPFINDLDTEKYGIYLRGLKNEVALFREENIAVGTEISMKAKDHGRIFSEMTVEVSGTEMTLQQAAVMLEETNRAKREAVYHKIQKRRLVDKEELESLFDELTELRHQVALNADFGNYRDYKFQKLGRFDYKIEDCFDFHGAISSEICPIVDELNLIRKKDLNLEKLRPWDLEVDASGKAPLRPFEGDKDLIAKSIKALTTLDPYFGECLAIMQEMGHLDLESRKGKRPGGYNMPLHLTGVPFIFMNSANSLNDLRTLMHEGGHAVHSFLTREIPLTESKRLPSEVAELAAMTMELLTMDYWNMFFDNAEDLRRAKINQLENILKILPWIAIVDKFQHWIYTNHGHSQEERKEAWLAINKEFGSEVVDREGFEHYSDYSWHRQLHIYEVPFYYIEYGMAQLGAIAIWKNYRENPKKAVQNYINALKLAYTKPIGEIYKTAGIEFNFSKEYVRDLALFVKKELESLISVPISSK